MLQDSILSGNFSSITTASAVAVVLSLAWLWWRKPSQKFPPGPRGIPILGVLPWLGERPERVFKKWSQEIYGPVMSARFGMEDVVVLNNFDAIQQALVKQGFDFSGRPNIKIFTQIVGEKNGLGFAQYDENFIARKKFTINTFKKFGQGKQVMEKMINEEADFIVEFLKSHEGKPFEIGKTFHNFIGNIMCRVVFGRRFELELDDPSFQKVFEFLTNTSSDSENSASFVALLFFYDYVKYFPPFSTFNRKHVQSERYTMEKFASLINEHKESFDENHIRDYIDAFIYEQKFGNNSDFSDKQLAFCVRDLFAAGTDTSSGLLCWLILTLLHFPEHHEKVVEEIDRVIGEDQWPSMANRSEMPFTCAFIQEVNRYLPMGPLAITHFTQNDVNLAGYHIPKGTKVIPNIWGAHFDSETWKDPFKFDPYRYIDEEGHFVPSKKVISFSVGPRFCPGESIARMEMFLILVRMLQKLTFTSTGEPLPSLLSGFTALAHTSRPFEVIVNAR